jgi:hypothetical protein
MPQLVPSKVLSKVHLNDLLAVFGFTINFYIVCILPIAPTIVTFLLVIADALSLFLSLFVTDEDRHMAMAVLETGIRRPSPSTETYLYTQYIGQFADDDESNHVLAYMEDDFHLVFENATLHVTANRPINIPVQVVNQSDEIMSESVSTLTAPSDSMYTSRALP